MTKEEIHDQYQYYYFKSLEESIINPNTEQIMKCATYINLIANTEFSYNPIQLLLTSNGREIIKNNGYGDEFFQEIINKTIKYTVEDYMLDFIEIYLVDRIKDRILQQKKCSNAYEKLQTIIAEKQKRAVAVSREAEQLLSLQGISKQDINLFAFN